MIDDGQAGSAEIEQLQRSLRDGLTTAKKIVQHTKALLLAQAEVPNHTARNFMDHIEKQAVEAALIRLAIPHTGLTDSPPDARA